MTEYTHEVDLEEEDVDSFLYGENITQQEEERKRKKEQEQREADLRKQEEEIYGAIGKEKQEEEEEAEEVEDNAKNEIHTTKMKEKGEGEEEDDDDNDNEEDEDDVEIVLNLPSLEEIEGRKAAAINGNNLNLKSNKYVKPGMLYTPAIKVEANGVIQGQSYGSLTGVNIDAVAQYQGKDILEVDMESLEDKPWRKPGADISDYFNYGFNEQTWRQYCQKQLHLRMEYNVHKRINVYESTKNDLERMELPPELRALTREQEDLPPMHDGGTGGGRGDRRGRGGGGGHYQRRQPMRRQADDIIQIQTHENGRDRRDDYRRPVQAYAGHEEEVMPPFMMPDYHGAGIMPPPPFMGPYGMEPPIPLLPTPEFQRDREKEKERELLRGRGRDPSIRGDRVGPMLDEALEGRPVRGESPGYRVDNRDRNRGKDKEHERDGRDHGYRGEREVRPMERGVRDADYDRRKRSHSPSRDSDDYRKIRRH